MANIGTNILQTNDILRQKGSNRFCLFILQVRHLRFALGNCSLFIVMAEDHLDG